MTRIVVAALLMLFGMAATVDYLTISDTQARGIMDGE